jgi:hypothetical protein
MHPPITRLILAEWIKSKIWILFLFGFFFAALAGPLLSSADLDPNMTAPARAQWLFGFGFLLLFIYLPAFATEFGSKQFRNGLRLFYRAQGVSDASYFGSTVLGALVPALFVGVLLLAALIFLGIPNQSLMPKFQSVALTLLAAFAVIPFAVGLSQVIAPSIAFMAAMLINLVGLYAPAGLEYLHETANPRLQYVVEIAMTFIPDLRFGDQSLRVTFGWPGIDLLPWLAACAYLLVLTIISYAAGSILFRLRSV